MPGHTARAAGGGVGEGPVTIDPDTTDVEVYGRRKRGVATACAAAKP
jgi:hypothetical protein